MASALDAILQIRQSEQDQRNLQQQQIMQAFQNFQQSRQFNAQQQLAGLQTKIGAAQSGIAIGPNNELSYNPSLLNPLSQVMMGAKLQADAKTAGNPALYKMAGGAINNLLGDQEQPSTSQAQGFQTSQGTINPQSSPVDALQGQAVASQVGIPQQSTEQPQGNTARAVIDQAAPKASTENQTLASQPDYTSEIDAFTGKPTLRAELQKNQLDIAKNSQSKTKEYGDTQATGFANAGAKLQLTLENWHKMTQATQDQFGVGPGRISGLLSKLGGATGTNPYYQPFKTSLLETEVQMAKLSAPSARIGPDLIKTFGVVAPTEFNNSKEARNNYITSLTNAYSTYATSNPDKFPDGANIDKFQELASKMYDQIVDQGAMSKAFKDGQQYRIPGKDTVYTAKGGRLYDQNGKMVNVNMGGKK